jgi:hypothetical protein
MRANTVVSPIPGESVREFQYETAWPGIDAAMITDPVCMVKPEGYHELTQIECYPTEF